MQRIAWAALSLMIWMCGCNSVPAPQGVDADPDYLYPWGTPRQDLETRYGKTKFYWVPEREPEDAFAAATMRQMLAAGKARARSYQVFSQVRPEGGAYADYVFYNDREQVLYTARRSR